MPKHGSVSPVVTDAIFELAEGVIWDDRAGLVRGVDIWEGRILAGQLDDSRIVVCSVIRISQSAGAVALAEDEGFLVAASRGLATISPTGAVSIGPDLLGDRSGSRLNDGSVDPQGRFIVGTLSHTGKAARDLGVEQLLRVSPDGRVEKLRDSLRRSNGIGFSPSGDEIYHVDTFARTASSHSYGPGAFDTDEPWVTVLDEPDLPAHPDGLTVDSTGALWVAHWGLSSVRRHAVNGGEVARHRHCRRDTGAVPRLRGRDGDARWPCHHLCP